MEAIKSIRSNFEEYQKIKQAKLSWKAGMRSLFMNSENWKILSRKMRLGNVPTNIDDRIKLQAEIKRFLKTV